MLYPDTVTSPHSTRFVELTCYPNGPFLATLLDREFCHVLLLPEKWPAESLFRFAESQAAANRLPTFLVPDRASCFEFPPEGSVRVACIRAQWGWTLIEGMLAPAFPIPDVDDVAIRHALFDFFAHNQHGERYPSGDPEKAGRPSGRRDIERLGGGVDGAWPGLDPCPLCGGLRGEVLERSPLTGNLLVLPVTCCCDNDNRCAGCGELLAGRKLRSNEYDPADGKFLYTPGFLALRHRCDSAGAVLGAGREEAGLQGDTAAEEGDDQGEHSSPPGK